MRLRAWIAPRDKDAIVDPPYYPKFGFVWWWWFPTFYHQKPEVLRGYYNARELRIIWLCFAVNLSVGFEGTK